MKGLYLYCIIRQGSPTELNGLRGVDDQPVHAFTGEGMTAFVSEIEADDFSNAPGEHLGSLEWLEPKLRAHEKVNAMVLGQSDAILPMKFATIFKERGHLTECLEEHAARFTELLTHVHQKQEWGVKVFARLSEFIDKIRKRRRIQRREARLREERRGAAYFLQKKLDDQVGDLAERELRRCRERMTQTMMRAATAWVSNDIWPREATGSEDNMVLNASYLVSKEQHSRWMRDLERIQEMYVPFGFNIICTGPWPPYNFVELTGCVPSLSSAQQKG